MSNSTKNKADVPAGKYVLAIVFIVFVFTVVAIASMLRNRWTATIQKPMTYDECVTEPGSSILEIYPEICVTRDGTRFTRPIPTHSANILRPTAIQVNANEHQQGICENNNGSWLPGYNECEGLRKETCEQAGGIFDPCASACRHNPNAGACIQICVPVCSF